MSTFKMFRHLSPGDIFIVKCCSAGHDCSTDVLLLFIASFGHIKVPLMNSAAVMLINLSAEKK